MYRHDIFSFIILLGVIQGVFLSFFFLRQKHGNRLSSIFLGLILFFFAFLNFDFWSGYTLVTLRFPHLLDISVPFSLAMGPFIYHYTRYFLFSGKEKYFFMHYLPAVFFIFYSLCFYLQPAAFKYNVFVQSRGLSFPMQPVALHFSADPWHIRAFTGVFLTCQLIIYLLLSTRLYYLFKSGKEGARKIATEGIFWLRNTLIATSVIITIAAVIQVYFAGGRVEYILATSFTLFIYFTSYQVLRNSEFYKQGILKEKYSKSSLNEMLRDDLVKKIDLLMNNEKPYLDNLFSLKSFARAVSASPNHVSQILNEFYGESFFEYISRFRIKEAQLLLSDQKNRDIKIEQVADQVGYNSKAAFNKAFKRITGQTPLSFKRSALL
jgi:AraC-like DNA-binding protein